MIRSPGARISKSTPEPFRTVIPPNLNHFQPTFLCSTRTAEGQSKAGQLPRNALPSKYAERARSFVQKRRRPRWQRCFEPSKNSPLGEPTVTPENSWRIHKLLFSGASAFQFGPVMGHRCTVWILHLLSRLYQKITKFSAAEFGGVGASRSLARSGCAPCAFRSSSAHRTQTHRSQMQLVTWGAFTGGMTQEPLRIEGGLLRPVQAQHEDELALGGAGSQFDSLSAPGMSFWM